jgi:hypothetical protein
MIGRKFDGLRGGVSPNLPVLKSLEHLVLCAASVAMEEDPSFPLNDGERSLITAMWTGSVISGTTFGEVQPLGDLSCSGHVGLHRLSMQSMHGRRLVV